jgi:dTDP-4-amino-4,6-dideoxy-D-galactose acyltransferase
MQKSPVTFCEYLSWDSEFFGCRIARLLAARLSLNLVKQVEDWCSGNAIDCLYYLTEAGDEQSMRLAAAHDFGLVDIRMTLSRELGHGEPKPARTIAGLVRLVRPEDLPALRAIARKSHRDTRFYFDPHFPREKCNELYETWIEKSCASYADTVLVAEYHGDAVGYISCKTQQPKVGQIGLLAIDGGAAGLGLGSALVAEALDWCRSQSHERVVVVTQGRNVRAQRCYQKSSFLTESVHLWYHRWFSSAQSASASNAGLP